MPAETTEEQPAKPLHWDALVREWALAHATHASVQSEIARLESRIAILRQALSGVASNGTNCQMCQLLNGIARETLERDEI